MDAAARSRLREVRTRHDMRALLSDHGRPEADYGVGTLVTVWDKMQEGYSSAIAFYLRLYASASSTSPGPTAAKTSGSSSRASIRRSGGGETSG